MKLGLIGYKDMAPELLPWLFTRENEEYISDGAEIIREYCLEHNIKLTEIKHDPTLPENIRLLDVYDRICKASKYVFLDMSTRTDEKLWVDRDIRRTGKMILVTFCEPQMYE